MFKSLVISAADDGGRVAVSVVVALLPLLLPLSLPRCLLGFRARVAVEQEK